ncbi:DUF805 domain-containing protein [Marinimicrobium sp. ABcell2]|uniref:DUF805 domain-containing protein n=1 Tax=Marinimicrobium sp. ABcell2 TaxID=3069751 RepID=UPI0027B4E4FF|nr:DUF805 domain-containing protein [Marinimicrobium sp. ABcell2]MDQ2076385.1 DUF805 domain-containing protein [Marinimicrobium sp. ABcell2]
MDWKWYLFSFEGRINRSLFWAYVIPLTVALIAIDIYADSPLGELSTPSLLFIVLTLWPSLAVQAKRWHDTGRSGWWTLINLIPFGGIWALIVTGAFPSDANTNRFGAPPNNSPTKGVSEGT